MMFCRQGKYAAFWRVIAILVSVGVAILTKFFFPCVDLGCLALIG
jgi:hypothetical protein